MVLEMGWIEKKPRDVTGQFLEYAASGRLIEVKARKHPRSTVLVIVAAAIAIGFGAALIAFGLTGTAGPGATVAGLTAFVGGISVLAPSLKLLRTNSTRGTLDVRPGAVLLPDLVRKGNWIHRGGAWVRIEHVGRDGGGRVHALLGSGDVVELRNPVTVAGDAFRPGTDPVESLRH